MSTKLTLGKLAAPLVLAASVALPAYAQQGTLDVITVSARKTEETLQTVPVTVSAIAGQQMERFQYDKIEDVTARIPTLNVQIGGSGSGAQLSLRGVSYRAQF